jgi:single-stranded-DNA-specific exonuclease
VKSNPSSLGKMRWRFPETGDTGASEVLKLAASLDLQPLLAAVLCRRGLSDPGAARNFLEADAGGLHDPWLLPDMAAAVETALTAMERGEAILIHGDYDVDGVSAAALLQRALSALGAKIEVHLPHRLGEGFGLGRQAIAKAAADDISLIITADCGSGSPDAVAYARSLGLKVIITDHHRPSPDAVAPEEKVPEVNPCRPDSNYPFRDLSGVGVAFKFVEALAARKNMPPQAHWRFLDLVALGTVADVSPLIGENRTLVRKGLDLIGNSRKLGLAALLRAAGLSAPVSSRQVAFILAPRINAAGRIADAEESFRLLTTGDPAEAELLAGQLCRHNSARQSEEARTLQEAKEMIESLGLQQDPALMLAGDGWHPGVIGIVASRLAETFLRPVFVAALSREAENKPEAVGSARGLNGFNIWQALHHCRHCLLRYGGHDQAGGFSVLPENIPALREGLNEFASQYSPAEDMPELKIDAEAKLSDLTLTAVEELRRLEPTGAGNPEPVIAVKGLKILELSPVGKDRRHLRILLQEPEGTRARTIWFRPGNQARTLAVGQNVTVALSPTIGSWNGNKSLDLRITDLLLGEESGA